MLAAFTMYIALDSGQLLCNQHVKGQEKQMIPAENSSANF